MGKFIEFGWGNRWLIRTEFEKKDGSEYEVRGISGKIMIRSLYLRIWFFHQVFIFDSLEGIKRQSKDRNAFKFIFGIHSD